uniref:MMPL family protein n=1 Tax=Candidatus Kentrum sp. LFY TaxID=2126342 RepID=A0A450UMJ6_9GAMM|nr:MAG: MMPL family protein [Candidatus Kentron sp. LFY]
MTVCSSSWPPRDGEIFTRKTLMAVQWLTKEAWQIPYSLRIDSITNFQYCHADGDDVIIGDLIPDAARLSEADVARARKISLDEPSLVNNLISPTAHVTGIDVTIQLPDKALDRGVSEVVKFIRELERGFVARYPDIEVYLTGTVVFNNAFPEASKRDMATLIPIMFLVIVAALWRALRFISGVFSTILVIGFSIVGSLGLAGSMGISLTGVSNVAPIVILTIAVADGVHILTTLRLQAGRGKHAAIVETLRINLQPISLTSLTTAIGFLGVNFSGAPPFRDLGNIVAMGVIIAFVLSITFLPALMAILPLPDAVSANTTRAMNRLGEFVVKRYRVLIMDHDGNGPGTDRFSATQRGQQCIFGIFR